MKCSLITMLFCIMAVSTGTCGVSMSAENPSATFDVTASNWKFASTPTSIAVHVGERVTLRLSSSEGVHGIASQELGIAKTIIVPGKSTTISFVPQKAGVYMLRCVIPCGPGHDDMAFVVKVAS